MSPHSPPCTPGAVSLHSRPPLSPPPAALERISLPQRLLVASLEDSSVRKCALRTEHTVPDRTRIQSKYVPPRRAQVLRLPPRTPDTRLTLGATPFLRHAARRTLLYHVTQPFEFSPPKEPRIQILRPRKRRGRYSRSSASSQRHISTRSALRHTANLGRHAILQDHPGALLATRSRPSGRIRGPAHSVAPRLPSPRTVVAAVISPNLVIMLKDAMQPICVLQQLIQTQLSDRPVTVISMKR
ncbi:hypothetical protein C8J57DRAFT_1255468 [Mycena rebaudengoi]|nr:hypothetical protein C8J57DRAFT_1255468 [Mycena rebaudengoi]